MVFALMAGSIGGWHLESGLQILILYICFITFSRGVKAILCLNGWNIGYLSL